MKLFELKSTITWTWTETFGDITARFFTPEGKKYDVVFVSGEEGGAPDELMKILQNYSPEDIFEVYFSFFNTEQVSFTTQTGTGESVTVFAAVLGIVKEFITREGPQALFFSADISEPSRIRLYDTIARRMQNSNWNIQTFPNIDGKKWYLVTRK